MSLPNTVAAELPADAFSLTPDPARVFPSRDHSEALATLKRGLDERRRLLVAVAEVGLGKTTLAYALLSSLPNDMRTAYIANPRLPLEGLVRHALADFGVRSDARDRAPLLAALAGFVEECAAAGHLAVFVIDEAQSLEDDTFDDLHLLLDLETDARKSLQLILLGQPELDAKLRQPRLRKIAARVAGRVHLKPLDEDESRRYVAHRLEQSGSSVEMFSAPALDLILRRAQGVPRRMNILCHNALLLAYAAGAAHVTRAMAQEAINDLTGGPLRRLVRSPAEAAAHARRSQIVRTVSTAAVLVAAGGFLALQLRRPAAPTRAQRGLPDAQARRARPDATPGRHDVARPQVPAPATTRPTTVVAVADPVPAPPVAAPPAATPPPAPKAPEAVAAPPPTVAAAPAAAPPPARPIPPLAVVPPVLPPAPVARVAPPVEEPRAKPLPPAPPAVKPLPPPTAVARATPPPVATPPAKPPAPGAAPARPVEPPPVQLARTTPSPAPEPPSEAPPPAAPVAAPAGVSDAEIRALLERYARAWHAQDVTELRRIGQIADDRQAEALARYFQDVRDLEVEVHVLEMGAGGDRRTVRFTRRDRFRDPRGHQVSQESPPIEKTIMRTPDGLKFAPRS
jgi:general secretion pathway protein A